MSWLSRLRLLTVWVVLVLGGAVLVGPARADTGPVPSIQFDIYEFEAIKIGSTNGTMWGVQNVGSADLVISSVVLEGPDASSFSITNGCLGKPVMPGQWCSAGLSFSPKRTGTFEAAVVLTSNGGQARAELLGTGSPLNLQVAPSPVVFGEHVTETSTALTVRVTNSDENALPIPGSGIVLAGAPAYSLTSDGCSGTTLAAKASCVVSLTFAPTAPGSFTGQVRIPVNATVVEVSGSAVSPAPKEQAPAGARAKLPSRIKAKGVTRIAGPNPVTTANMPITTQVIGSARKPGGRYLTVVRAKNGAIKVRTYASQGCRRGGSADRAGDSRLPAVAQSERLRVWKALGVSTEL